MTIDWLKTNKEIALETGMSLNQVQYRRSIQPPPHNRRGQHGPRKKTDQELLSEFPLVSDDRMQLETLAKAYRITYHKVRYLVRRLGLPRSLKNYRKGRGQ